MSVSGIVKTQNVTVQGSDYFRVAIDGNNFDLPYKKIGDNNVAFLDISGKFKLIELCADALVRQFIDKGIEFDTIANPVSKSNALAHAIAVRWAGRSDPGFCNTVVARKSAASTGLENAM